MKSIDDIARYQLMVRLVKYRMRTKDISFITGLALNAVKRAYDEIHGSCKAPVGKMPHDYKFFVETKRRQRESMQLMNLFKMAKMQLHDEPGKDRNTIEGTNALIDAYEDFLQINNLTTETTSFDFARAWQLHTLLEKGVLTLEKCTRCGAHFVVHYEMVANKKCEFCLTVEKSNKDTAGSSVATEAKTDAANHAATEADVEHEVATQSQHQLGVSIA